jgi:D-alanyl-D-alanine endopeptidase (penicillin-binding protein 7)
VLLDSAGKYSRIGDAERIRKWLASSPLASQALAPQPAVTGPLVQPIDLVKLR